MAAANALADLEATDAIPALKAALQDPDPAVRNMVAVALARLGDESGGVTMQSLTESPVGELRLLGIRAAARDNPQGPWADAVQGLLKDPDPLLRLKAARVLLESGRRSEAASAALDAALTDETPGIRTEAARLLREVGQQQPAAQNPAYLRRLLRDRAARGPDRGGPRPRHPPLTPHFRAFAPFPAFTRRGTSATLLAPPATVDSPKAGNFVFLKGVLMGRTTRTWVVCCLGVLCLPGLAQAQATRLGPSFNLGGTTAPVDQPDVAFDGVHNQYLQVAGKVFIEAHLVNSAGALVTTFRVNAGGEYAQSPRVAFSPNVPGGGGYLVTWHATLGNFTRVRGRIFRYDGAGRDRRLRHRHVGGRGRLRDRTGRWARPSRTQPPARSSSSPGWATTARATTSSSSV